MLQPTTVEDVQKAVRESTRLLPRGGGTKPALSTPTDEVTPLDLSALSGVLEYNPSEFTFTALAGTRVAEVQALLDAHGQYLPFDPPLTKQGATLGGTVAAGLSGPGRYRYGGVRDFILGVRLVDGNGEVVRGGGQVVKNAAGFDLPKLMVGSLGQLGVLVEVTFKVFPKAPAHVTILHSVAPLIEAMPVLYRLYTARMEIDALELEPNGAGMKFWVRMAGLPDALPARAERVRALLGGGEVVADGEAEGRVWEGFRSFSDVPAGAALVKIPVTPKRIPDLEAQLAQRDSMRRRYGSGGNVLWLTTHEQPVALHDMLVGLGLSGLVVFGPPGQARIGTHTGQAFEQRVKAVFDPKEKFG